MGNDIKPSGASTGRSRLVRQEEAVAGKPTFPELFFDLVFVFALIQLSHTLAEDFGSTALLEAAIIILALWWLWVQITWLTNLLNTEAGLVRLFLFSMMFLGVLLAIALPKAFDDQSFTFALIYSGMQVLRSLFALYVFKGIDHENSKTFGRMAVWLVASSIFWILGGLSESLGWQIGFWMVAIGIEYVGPAVKYFVPGFQAGDDEKLHLSGEHLAERCALFVIICLGETILTTGRTAADHMNSSLSFIVFCSAFTSTILMWWIYFHHAQEKASEKIEKSEDPEKIAHALFNYGHLPIVAGIILTAVGEDFSLSHSQESSAWREAIAIIGGPMLFLAGNIGVKIAASHMRPFSHFVGIFALLLLFLLGATPLYVLQISSVAVLLIVAIWEYVALKKHTPKVG